MNFGQAIEALKEGRVVARSGWNGKGMFIYLDHGSYDFGDGEYPENVEGLKISLFSKGDTGTTTRLPNINMRTATGSRVIGWLASQTDILGEDWEEAIPQNVPPDAP